MNILLNGEQRELPEGATLLEVVELLQLAGRRLAIEVNTEIVPKSRYAEHVLKDSDRVEIVHAIGGG